MLSSVRAVLGAVLLVALLPASHGAELGRFGYGLSVDRLSVDDPDGGGETTDLGFLNFYYFGKLDRNWRYLIELNHVSGGMDADANTVGQDFTSTGARATVQHNLRLSTAFKPWVGAGIGVHQQEFKRRYTVDNAGFLSNRLPDREVTQVSLSVEGMSQWEITPRWDWALRVRYDHGLSDGIDGLSASVLLIY